MSSKSNHGKPLITNIVLCPPLLDNTSNIVLKHGGFSLEDSRDYVIEIGISDGGRPPMSSITSLPIKVCRCDNKRIHTQCKAAQLKMGVSVHALIVILVCILIILGESISPLQYTALSILTGILPHHCP